MVIPLNNPQDIHTYIIFFFNIHKSRLFEGFFFIYKLFLNPAKSNCSSTELELLILYFTLTLNLIFAPCLPTILKFV